MKHCKPDEQWFSALRSWAKVAPLLAALIAPITSLMDIPALVVCLTWIARGYALKHLWQQTWYTEYGVQKSNLNTPRLVLSAIGLAFNLIANGLIVMRFSATSTYWKLATQLSLYCWIAKVSHLHLSVRLVWNADDLLLKDSNRTGKRLGIACVLKLTSCYERNFKINIIICEC